MKATLQFDNLEAIIQKTIEEDVNATINLKIEKIIENYLEKNAKQLIEDKVSNQLSATIDEYINSAVVTECAITDDEPTSYPLTKYIRMKVTDFIKRGMLTTTQTSSYSYKETRTTISFEEYINRKLNVESEVKKQLDSYLDKVRKDINARSKAIFETSTKEMLSNAALAILQQHNTYKAIETSLKTIADPNGNK